MCACINGCPFLSCLPFIYTFLSSSVPSCLPFIYPFVPSFLLSTPSFLHSFFSSFTFFASAMQSADIVVCGGSPTSDRDTLLFLPSFLPSSTTTHSFLPSVLTFLHLHLPSFFPPFIHLPYFFSSVEPRTPFLILFFYIFFRLPFLRSFAPSSLLPFFSRNG